MKYKVDRIYRIVGLPEMKAQVYHVRFSGPAWDRVHYFVLYNNKPTGWTGTCSSEGIDFIYGNNLGELVTEEKYESQLTESSIETHNKKEEE